ncbi:hypothetical protein L1987_68310 [Smallanthus sonchifolius]|uniref:Uncharacterized protein n=1 Tax=Smallanthus sonchifolius TaxID=185202 RepID=A0ACB9B4K7_9ASTR|nr:hypothetical protein L1987_68310 [Smallanthus sonchifolius]
MVKPHVLLLPGPAQGHVIPLMELDQRLVKHGAKVTCVNTEVTHKVIMGNWLENNGMQMVSIPDGLEPWEDRNEYGKLMESMIKTMPSKLEQVIERINKQDDNKITCLIVDMWLAFAPEVAKKMGIRRVTFFPASTATLATVMSIPKLIDDGIPLNSEMIRLREGIPPIKPENLLWTVILDPTTIEVHFQNQLKLVEYTRITEWFICNSAVELEPAAFSLFPLLVPIGPLLASNRLADQVLAHPSIACFMSHCGWNSTLEGVTNGVPFLCWPYFADQFYNETYICDIWKTGLGLKKEETSIVTREEIKSKAVQLLSDETFKSKALDMKEKVATSVTKGGCSHSLNSESMVGFQKLAMGGPKDKESEARALGHHVNSRRLMTRKEIKGLFFQLVVDSRRLTTRKEIKVSMWPRRRSERVKDDLSRDTTQREQLVEAIPLFAKEVIIGGVAKTIVATLECIKILFQTRSEFHNIGLLAAFRRIARIVPYAALHYMAYEQYRW